MVKKSSRRSRRGNNSKSSKITSSNSIGPVVNIRSSYFNSLVSSSSSAISAGVVYCYLNDFADTAAYSSVFDQYRINWLKVNVLPTTNFNVPGASAETNNYLITVIDFDDSNSLTSVAQALSYATATIHPPARVFHRTFVPCYDLGIGDSYGGTISTNAIVSADKQWINTNRGTVRCFGLKYLIPQTSTTNIYSWNFFVTASISFRASR
jgi:hypothetical protein